MKQTAVEWLIGRFHYEGFIGTYCSEEQIKSKRQLMIEIINQAKEIEKQQIIESYKEFLDTTLPNEVYEEFYNETFKQQ